MAGPKHGPGPGPGRGPGGPAPQKPKNVGRTIARLGGYVAKNKLSLVLVLLCLLASVATNRDVRAILGDRTDDAAPNAVILSYGVVSYDGGKTHMGTFKNISGNNPDRFEELDPVRMLTPTSAPAFLWHTRRDQGVPFRNSVNYALACDELGIPCELHIYDHGCHGISLANPATAGKNAEESAATWPELAEKWLRNMLGFALQL